MTEIERLTELGTGYLKAAREVMLDDRHKRGKLYLGMPTTDTIIAIAQVIAAADRQESRPGYGTRIFETHFLEWPSNLFEGRWNHEGMFSEKLEENEDQPELAAPGDLLHLQEVEDDRNTCRSIIYQIISLRQGDEGTLHIEANFVARKGGTP